jgi:hypothetical protein
MDKIIFSHIPKAAGNAIRAHLWSRLPVGLRILVHSGGASALVSSGLETPDCSLGLSPADWPIYKLPHDWLLLTGHLKVSDLLANPEVQQNDTEIVLFSILRDPIDRIISLYNYARSTPHHPKFDAMQGVAFESFLIRHRANAQSEWLKIPDGLA